MDDLGGKPTIFGNTQFLSLYYKLLADSPIRFPPLANGILIDVLVVVTPGYSELYTIGLLKQGIKNKFPNIIGWGDFQVPPVRFFLGSIY